MLLLIVLKMCFSNTVCPLSVKHDNNIQFTTYLNTIQSQKVKKFFILCLRIKSMENIKHSHNSDYKVMIKVYYESDRNKWWFLYPKQCIKTKANKNVSVSIPCHDALEYQLQLDKDVSCCLQVNLLFPEASHSLWRAALRSLRFWGKVTSLYTATHLIPKVFDMTEFWIKCSYSIWDTSSQSLMMQPQWPGTWSSMKMKFHSCRCTKTG